MTKEEIKIFIDSFSGKQDRVMIVVDYGNVEKWKYSLNWRVGIKELAKLCKNFSTGKRFLRRFYYGADYGKNELLPNIGCWEMKKLIKIL